MEVRLDGRVAVVTGGGRGIGAAIAAELAASGCSVGILDRDLESAGVAAADLARHGTRVAAEMCDVADEGSVHDAFASLRDELGDCDILINNAGISRPEHTAGASLSAWDAVLGVNLRGVFLCTRAVLSAMTERGWGRIVSLSSFAAKAAPIYADNASYAASKAGVIGFTHNVALEAAPFGVTVNAVAPGIVDTDMFRGAHGPERRGELQQRVPVREFVRPEAVAALAVFLCSDAAASITGQTISINGGLHLD